MAIGEEPEISEAQIAVHWREEEYILPPPRFVGQANAHDPAILERFREENFPECFREYADLLSWDQYWHTTLDSSNPPFWKSARRRSRGIFPGRPGGKSRSSAWATCTAWLSRRRTNWRRKAGTAR